MADTAKSLAAEVSAIIEAICDPKVTREQLIALATAVNGKARRPS
jgi:hypothetical protein